MSLGSQGHAGAMAANVMARDDGPSEARPGVSGALGEGARASRHEWRPLRQWRMVRMCVRSSTSK